MAIRTDLAVECLDMEDGEILSGISKEVFSENGLEVTRVRVENESGAAKIGKPMGEYLTVDTSDFKQASGQFEMEVTAIAGLIRSLLPPSVTPNGGAVLVVGLGNREITPDALGPKAADAILATRHISRELAETIGLEGIFPVAVVAAGVMGQTGIETAEITAALAKAITPSAILVIDSLAAKSIERLATTVQISNTGISPGSGVQNSRTELSEHTLGVPVISIGVPMVVDMLTVVRDMLGQEKVGERILDKGRSMMVTPREIDLAVEHAARTVAFAVNMALQPNLTLEELMGLVG